MQKRPYVIMPFASLLTGVSFAALLAACDMVDGMKNPFDSSRPKQEVVGVRRVPLLNQAPAGSASASPGSTVAPQANPSRAYDYYDSFDASGRQVNPLDAAAAPRAVSASPAPPQPLAPAEPAPLKESEGFDWHRLFGGNETPPAPPSGPQRKPLPSNPYYSGENNPPAPISPPPEYSSPAPAPAPMAIMETPAPPPPVSMPAPRTVPPGVPSWAIIRAGQSAKPPPPPSGGAAPQPQANATPGIPPDTMLSAEAARPLVTQEPPVLATAPGSVSAAIISPPLDAPILAKTDPSPSEPLVMAEGSPVSPPVYRPSFFTRLFDSSPAPISPPQEQAAAAPVTPPSDGTPGTYKPQWFGHWVGKEIHGGEDPPADAGTYPPLSSVPATPEEFKEVQGEKQQAMHELQSDHGQAQQDKQLLESEPSQQGKPSSAAMPMPPVVSVPIPHEAPQSAAGEPVLLGQISSAPTGPTSVAGEVMVAAHPDTAAAPTAFDTPKRGSWWQEWNPLSGGSAPGETAPAPANAASGQ